MTTTDLIHKRIDASAISKIDEIVAECGLITAAQQQGVMAAFQMAAGIGMLKNLITDEMMRPIMDLQGSSLGFRTDKDKEGGYDLPTVKECVVEALLRGARAHGNEFNIISSRCYLTKEYFQRIMSAFPGLTDFVFDFGVPQLSEGGKGALVTARATWKYHGRPGMLVCDLERDAQGRILADGRIPVRANSGQGADAILGKAERKLRARVLGRITNTTWSDGDVQDGIDASFASQSVGHEPDDDRRSLKDRLKQTPHRPANSQDSEPNTTEAPRQEETLAAAPSEKPARTTTVAPETQPAESLEPADGEPVKEYHTRVGKLIARLDGAFLMDANDIFDGLLARGYLTRVRHTDLIQKLNDRNAHLVGAGSAT